MIAARVVAVVAVVVSEVVERGSVLGWIAESEHLLKLH